MLITRNLDYDAGILRATSMDDDIRHRRASELFYQLLFCACIVVGSALSLGAVTDFSDGMLLAMCFPNLIGVYFLLPVVKQELTAFHAHATAIDAEEHSKG